RQRGIGRQVPLEVAGLRGVDVQGIIDIVQQGPVVDADRWAPLDEALDGGDGHPQAREHGEVRDERIRVDVALDGLVYLVRGISDLDPQEPAGANRKKI